MLQIILLLFTAFTCANSYGYDHYNQTVSILHSQPPQDPFYYQNQHTIHPIKNHHSGVSININSSKPLKRILQSGIEDIAYFADTINSGFKFLGNGIYNAVGGIGNAIDSGLTPYLENAFESLDAKIDYFGESVGSLFDSPAKQPTASAQPQQNNTVRQLGEHNVAQKARNTFIQGYEKQKDELAQCTIMYAHDELYQKATTAERVTFSKRDYPITAQALNLLDEHNLPKEQYTTVYNNAVQHEMHTRIVHIVERTSVIASEKKECTQTTLLCTTVISCNDIARECNEHGYLVKTITIINFCTTSLDYAQAIDDTSITLPQSKKLFLALTNLISTFHIDTTTFNAPIKSKSSEITYADKIVQALQPWAEEEQFDKMLHHSIVFAENMDTFHEDILVSSFDAAQIEQGISQQEYEQIYERSTARLHAYNQTVQHPTICITRNYPLSEKTHTILTSAAINPEDFTVFHGNELQQQLHAEVVTIIDTTCNYASNERLHPQLVNVLLTASETARVHNKNGNMWDGFCVADLCWLTLDTIHAVGEGVVSGIWQAGQGIAANPIPFVLTPFIGKYVLCYKGLQFAGTLLNFGYTYVTDPETAINTFEAFKLKTANAIKTFNNLNYHDKVSFITACATQLYTEQKALNLLNRGYAFGGAVVKQVQEHARKPQRQMVTPEGVHFNANINGNAGGQSQGNKPPKIGGTQNVKKTNDFLNAKNSLNALKEEFEALGLKPISEKNLKHIIKNHTFNEQQILQGKSIFNDNIDIIKISIEGWRKGTPIDNQTKVFDVGKSIGITKQGIETSKIKIVLNGTLDSIRTVYPL